MGLQLKTFYDAATYTLTYVLYDQQTRDAVVIDPVWDYDQAASKTSTESVEMVEKFIKDNKFQLHYILETHAHADHLSGAIKLRERFPIAKIAIGKHITQVQKVFAELFNLKNFKTDGSQFDVLLDEGQNLQAGTITIKTIFTPGHTPACASYLIGNMLFTGDALFMPDYGTGRCDFPAGCAKDLYHSVHNKLYELPEETRVFTGHDYQPGGRELRYESTIGDQKKHNIHIKASTTEDEFVKFRNDRDKTLAAPKLLLPSVQMNINAGDCPTVEDNGVPYLKIPIR